MQHGKLIWNGCRIFLFSGLLILAACGFGPADDRYYRYCAYDSTGIAIVTGWLTMDLPPAGPVSGEWIFNRLVESSMVGPQIGSGRFVGGVDSNRIWLNLNPDWADNNVLLNGVIVDATINGEWNYSNFVGPVNSGSFTATAVKNGY